MINIRLTKKERGEYNRFQTALKVLGEHQRVRFLEKLLDGWSGWDDVEFGHHISRRLTEKATAIQKGCSLDVKEDLADIANLTAFLYHMEYRRKGKKR